MVLATRLKWQVLSGVMRSIGCTSRGIALGYEQGFDSGVMLDYVYENRAHGRFGVGWAIDWVYLRAIGWRAIRARRAVLTAVLREAVTAAGAGRAPVTVLDVAGGPGRYLQDLCRAWQAEAQPVTVVCRDLDLRGLALGRTQAATAGLTNIRYEQGDAFDARSLAAVSPAPGIVVVSGLYELFVDPAPIRRSLQTIYDLLPPGGQLIFTTQVRHPQLDFIANVLVNRDGQPWVMVCRPLAEVEGWARAAGFSRVQSQLEPVGLFGVTVCHKA
jgi:SAM-dependent methyltransferase